MKHADLKDLAGRLLGSVTDSAEVIDHFSTDQSIIAAEPTAVVYPQNTADVRKTIQFAAERAAAGKPMPLIARGKGSGSTGAAVGEGIQVVFPAHMHKLLRLDRVDVSVQPGIIFQTLQQTLHTHGRFIPPYPSSLHYATVGGIVSSGVSGERSGKYGDIRQWVKGLKVALSDGSLIETGRLSARELSRKKGLMTLEGEIYRKLDSLLLDNADMIASHSHLPELGSSGYGLRHVRGKNGSFDLTQIFIGAEGTLGHITEVTLATAPYSPRTTLLVGYFDKLEGAGEAAERLQAFGPSSVEFIDRGLIDTYRAYRPADLEGIMPDKTPAVVLLVEFDNFSQFAQKLRSTRAEHMMRRHGAVVRRSTDPIEQIALWKMRRAGVVAWYESGSKPGIPFIDDAVVPPAKLTILIEKATKLLKKHDLEPAFWGHATLGVVRLAPRLDLAKKRDVSKLFTLMQEYTDLVLSLGGVPSASGDGPVRGHFLGQVYGEDMAELMAATKHIFDPHNIFNPSAKSGASLDYVKVHIRPAYARRHVHDFQLYN